MDSPCQQAKRSMILPIANQKDTNLISIDSLLDVFFFVFFTDVRQRVRKSNFVECYSMENL